MDPNGHGDEKKLPFSGETIRSLSNNFLLIRFSVITAFVLVYLRLMCAMRKLHI